MKLARNAKAAGVAAGGAVTVGGAEAAEVAVAAVVTAVAAGTGIVIATGTATANSSLPDFSKRSSGALSRCARKIYAIALRCLSTRATGWGSSAVTRPPEY